METYSIKCIVTDISSLFKQLDFIFEMKMKKAMFWVNSLK